MQDLITIAKNRSLNMILPNKLADLLDIEFFGIIKWLTYEKKN